MGVFLQKVYNMNNKSLSPSQNFAAEVTKLGAGDEIRRFDGSICRIFAFIETTAPGLETGQ